MGWSNVGNVKGPAGSIGNGYAPSHKWPAQEASGTSLVDTAGSVDLTASGGLTLHGATLPGFAVTATQAVLLNGSTGKLRSGVAPAGMAGYGFVLSWWWNPTGGSPGSDTYSVGYGNNTASSGLALNFNSSGFLAIVRLGAGTVSARTAAFTGWHRLSWYFPPSGASQLSVLYVDGLAVTSLSMSGITLSADANDALTLGCYPAAGGDGGFAPQAAFSRVAVVAVSTTSEAAIIAASDYFGQIGSIVQ